MRLGDESGLAHRPPVTEWYCSTMSAGMRPAAAERVALALAHAGMSALRARLATVGPGHCRCLVPTLRRVRSKRKLAAERSGASCVQVDLVVGAVDPEPHCRIRWAAVEIVVAIVVLVMATCTEPITCPAAITRTAPTSPPPPVSGEPNGEPIPADARPHQATTSRSFCS